MKLTLGDILEQNLIESDDIYIIENLSYWMTNPVGDIHSESALENWKPTRLDVNARRV